MQFLKVISIAAFCLISVFAASQDFENRFKSLQSKNDTVGERKLLQSWETLNPKDPGLFIAYFNYYVQTSRKEVVSLDLNKTNGQSFQVSDTGTGKTVGYLNSSIKYNSEILQKGFNYIDQGEMSLKY